MNKDDHAREKSLIEEGHRYCREGKLQEALVCLNKVIEDNPKSGEAFCLIGDILHQNGEMDKAIKAFTKVLELEPSHTDAALALSILYNDTGRYDQGRKVFEQARGKVKCSLDRPLGSTERGDTHLNKKFSYKHYELADLYMSHGRYDEALIEYNKTVLLDPYNLEARVKVGEVYEKKGFVAKAIAELNRLKREHPSYTSVRVALGLLYFSHARVIEAQAEWLKVLELDPNNERAEMYLKMCESATETKMV